MPYAVRPPEIDEKPAPGRGRRATTSAASRARSWTPCRRTSGEVVLCADTTVALGRRILGKPEDEGEAGGCSRCSRAAATASSPPSPCAAATALGARRDHHRRREAPLGRPRSRPISPPATGAARPASYAIQGPFGALIPWINGSFTGVVGLPLTETLGLLTAAG